MTATAAPPLAEIWRDQWRLLAFRQPGPGLGRAPGRYLAFGLAVTWLAGLGRYWDHPKAWWWQYAGLGSLAYVLVLATFLWLILWPLRPARWRWRTVLTFLTLTSLPALLYAIPVERFMSMATAQTANLGFLAVVATWRVALLLNFLRRSAHFNWLEVVIGATLPLALIVMALMTFNLEHAVFEFMAGLRNTPETHGDAAYGVVVLLAILSVPLAALSVLAWLFRIVQIRSERRDGVFIRD